MLAALPLLVAALVVLALWLEERRQDAWLRHPDRPWNVQARLQREAFELQRHLHLDSSPDLQRLRDVGLI